MKTGGIFTGDKELGSLCGRREEATCTEAEEAGDCSGQHRVPSGWTKGLKEQVQELWLERQAGTPAGLGQPITDTTGSENLCRRRHLILVASRGNKLQKVIWKMPIMECYAFSFLRYFPFHYLI